jgi:Fic family protein
MLSFFPSSHPAKVFQCLQHLACLLRAVQGAEETLAQVLAKARFWQRWAGTPMNDRQIKLLNKLLDGFDGKLSSSKWAAIAKCSQDTALRD